MVNYLSECILNFCLKNKLDTVIKDYYENKSNLS